MTSTANIPFPELIAPSLRAFPYAAPGPRPCPEASPELKAILAEITGLQGEFVQVSWSRSESRIQVEINGIGPGSKADKRRDPAAYAARLAAMRTAVEAAKATVSRLLPGGGWSYANQFDLFLPRADLAAQEAWTHETGRKQLSEAIRAGILYSADVMADSAYIYFEPTGVEHEYAAHYVKTAGAWVLDNAIYGDLFAAIGGEEAEVIMLELLGLATDD